MHTIRCIFWDCIVGREAKKDADALKQKYTDLAKTLEVMNRLYDTVFF